MSGIGIPNRVTRIPGDVWTEFQNDARREIAGGMFASNPVSRNGDSFVEWLFKAHLTASSIRCRYYIACEVVATKRNSCSAGKSLTCLGIEVIASVVSSVSQWEKDGVAHNNCPLVVLAVIWLPLDRRDESGGIGARLDVPGKVHSDLDTISDTSDDTRHE